MLEYQCQALNGAVEDGSGLRKSRSLVTFKMNAYVFEKEEELSTFFLQMARLF